MILAGTAVIVLFFGAFVGWAGTAPITSAAVAPGFVIVDGNRKTVQHLEGGIVARLLVREGQEVRAGEALIELDRTQAEATLKALDAAWIAAVALEARLRAEREGRNAMPLPDALARRQAEPAVARALVGQRDLFASRRRGWDEQEAIRTRQVARFRDQVAGLRDQNAALARQIALVRGRMARIAGVVRQGVVARTQYDDLEREKAVLEAEAGSGEAAVAEARQNVARLELENAERAAAREDEVIQGLRTVEEQIEGLESGIGAARDVLARKTIRAPIDGTVVGLKVFTEGGVIAPGSPILDIVPKGGRLVVEARLDPNDRDTAAPGQMARMRFRAFNQRLVGRVDGEVLSISADRLTDERTGTSFYRALIAIPDDTSEALGGAAPRPGMLVDTMIVTGERTPLGYLLRPILYNIDRALSED